MPAAGGQPPTRGPRRHEPPGRWEGEVGASSDLGTECVVVSRCLRSRSGFSWREPARPGPPRSLSLGKAQEIEIHPPSPVAFEGGTCTAQSINCGGKCGLSSLGRKNRADLGCSVPRAAPVAPRLLVLPQPRLPVLLWDFGCGEGLTYWVSGQQLGLATRPVGTSLQSASPGGWNASDWRLLSAGPSTS